MPVGARKVSWHPVRDAKGGLVAQGGGYAEPHIEGNGVWVICTALLWQSSVP